MAKRHRPRTQSLPLEPLESRRLLTATWIGDLDSNWGTLKLQGFPPTPNTNWSANTLPTSTAALRLVATFFATQDTAPLRLSSLRRCSPVSRPPLRRPPPAWCQV